MPSRNWGRFTLPATASAVVLLAPAFVLVETRAATAPPMPLRVFSARAVSVDNLIMLFVGAKITRHRDVGWRY